MKIMLLSLLLPASTFFLSPVIAQSHPPADTNLTMFGRGLYPGDDSTYQSLQQSGFTTIILSSFYIRANGDVLSGDDRKPIIHDGQYVGNKDWLTRVASLRQKPGSVTRIEILLEGRWLNQPPNTYDYIEDWTGVPKVPSTVGPARRRPGSATDTNLVAAPAPVITRGIAKNSTLYKIVKIFKEDIGVDAVCIDDESVYNSASIIELGKIVRKLDMHLTLCPFTNAAYWKAILDGSKKGLVDAVYVQCYDGGKLNTPRPWKDSLDTHIPVYPIFLCRGAFSTCASVKNGKSPDEIKSEMVRFKKDYPDLTGGAIWQMADVKNYIRRNCAVQSPESGTALSINEYLAQLKNSIQQGL